MGSWLLIALTVAVLLRAAPQTAGLNGAVPHDLTSFQTFQGTPWSGEPGKLESVTGIMSRAATDPEDRQPPTRLGDPIDETHKMDEIRDANPNASPTSQWPMAQPSAAPVVASANAPLTPGLSWVGVHASESGFVPPDATGAVGPTQVIALANGRLKVFDKAGNLGPLNVTDQTFFASVRGTASTCDPRVRYDRLSGRWFVSEITCGGTPNRILLAVSSGATITSTSSFSFFQFQQDQVGTTPNIDTGAFADYETLGVDANALYIGANMFYGASGFSVTGFVVNKASLLAGTLSVTAFRGLVDANRHGPVSPQGVVNDDPSWPEGYFIGADYGSYSMLTMRRIINPGGVPSISGNLLMDTPLTRYPFHSLQFAQNSDAPLDAIDDRLYAATIRKDKITGATTLWTAHNIGVNANGVASTPTRNGARWYQIGSLTTAPSLIQAGTLNDSAPASPVGYWMPSVASNGQGHMAMVASFAHGLNNYAGIAIAGRLAADSPGTISPAATAITGAGAYNDWCVSCSKYRWGDYSQIVTDPTDDQTMWAFATYTIGTDPSDSWGVRVTKLSAPPPAMPVSVTPQFIKRGVPATLVTVTGISAAGSGFFDPGSGYARRLSASIGGGVSVNAMTFVDPTHLVLNVSTVGATTGAQNVVVNNPDGQQAAANGLLTITSAGLTPATDLDGDAKSDLIVWRPGSGTFFGLTSSSGYAYESATGRQGGASGDVPFTGDVDGDARADLIVWRPSSGTFFWLTSTSGYNPAAAGARQWGANTDIPFVADLDGDGKVDFGVWRPETGTFFWLTSSSGYSYAAAMAKQWGAPGDIPLLADADGDGRADLAVWRPSNGTFFWLSSSSGYSYSAAVGKQWGAAGDVPLLADLDGDGKADPMVWRPASATFFWLTSTSGYSYAAAPSRQWGSSGDVPMIADIDGDTKGDLVFWRPSNGTFAWLTSSSGYSDAASGSKQWGGAGDTPLVR